MVLWAGSSLLDVHRAWHHGRADSGEERPGAPLLRACPLRPLSDGESFGALLVAFRDRDVFFDGVELAVVSHHRQLFVDDGVTLRRDDGDGLV